ncbi:MAG: tRNA uridine-5-carboxymethylaminomethyl(34) synthesis enzyme MnmG, partial [Catalinimonas sp.]
PRVSFRQDMVRELIVEDGRIKGVKTTQGSNFYSKSVVLTNGTFLNGTIHVGDRQMGGGRMGESKSVGITEQLVSLGFHASRMKTGTPPRVDGRSIDYSVLEEQKGDEEPSKFSYSTETKPLQRQLSCHITYTCKEVHDTLREGFHLSPMFNGRIRGIGPRYCPSIEDKIERFAEKDRHQLFVEPEGWETIEVYVNGFSTSLPEETQIKALRKVPGFRRAKLFRPGYAIEYDFFPPTQLKLSLETRGVAGLFFAGQINGTTGYEEAACQGLMAGINAYQYVKEEAPVIIGRDEGYIGVLIDDLVSKGTDEPYRMFTSRAEYRTLLRQDNADLRLTEKGYQLGIATEERWQRVVDKKTSVEACKDAFRDFKFRPEEINPILDTAKSSSVKERTAAVSLLKRPHVDLSVLSKLDSFAAAMEQYSPEVLEQAVIQLKYDSYIRKEQELAKRTRDLDGLKIPDNLDYYAIKALSNEAKEKLSDRRPTNLGQAGRISGIKPTDISILMVYLNR